MLVREPVVEAKRSGHALGDPPIDDGRRQRRGIVLLAAHREAHGVPKQGMNDWYGPTNGKTAWSVRFIAA